MEFQLLKAWHSLHLGTERYMTKPGGATISSVRPMHCEPDKTVGGQVAGVAYSLAIGRGVTYDLGRGLD